MKLIYHFRNKAIERSEQIRELEAIDKQCVEKLLDIEHKFKDVRVSVDDLIKEVQTLNQLGKEGAEMMKAMVERFDKAKAENDALRESIKQKDEDIVGLVTQIMGEYQKTTLKAHYKLLKEYKQGLLVDVDVIDEIELYEESLAEVESLTSASRKNTKPLASVVPR